MNYFEKMVVVERLKKIQRQRMNLNIPRVRIKRDRLAKKIIESKNWRKNDEDH